MFEDNQDVQHKVNFSTWKHILKIVSKSKKRIWLLVFFAGFMAFLDVLIPMMNRYAIDVFFKDKIYDTLYVFIGLYVLIAILFGVCIWGFLYQAGMIEAETSYELRRQAFENIQKLSFSYFDNTPQGWVMARLTSDANRLSNIISWGIVDFTWAILSVIFITTTLLIFHAVLALIIIVMVPLMIWIAYMFRRRILKFHRKARQFNSELTGKYSESFLGAKTTKSLGIEDQSMKSFEATANKMRKSSLKAVTASALFSSIILGLSYITVAIVMYVGGDMYLNDIHILGLSIGFGTLQMFITYAINFFQPIMDLSNFLSDFQNAQASAERIVGLIHQPSDLVDTKDVIEKYGTIFADKTENWEPMQGKIEFRDVTFYYKPEEPILAHFNLTINKGQTVALVGRTGSGKTTIVNLLARFYEPKEGMILIDDVDYRERSIHWLHKRLGYVLQSPHLFNTSIKNNIKYGKLDASDEEVIEAAKAVGAHDFIIQLKEGYDTSVGEGGNALSIGQKQLISFARALIAQPSILILDEATASIDSESEYMIQQATDQLLKDKTSIIVAHRLSTIIDADVIIVMDYGNILEMGNHEALIQKRGHYYELYRKQFFEENEAKIE